VRCTIRDASSSLSLRRTYESTTFSSRLPYLYGRCTLVLPGFHSRPIFRSNSPAVSLCLSCLQEIVLVLVLSLLRHNARPSSSRPSSLSTSIWHDHPLHSLRAPDSEQYWARLAPKTSKVFYDVNCHSYIGAATNNFITLVARPLYVAFAHPVCGPCTDVTVTIYIVEYLKQSWAINGATLPPLPRHTSASPRPIKGPSWRPKRVAWRLSTGRCVVKVQRRDAADARNSTQTLTLCWICCPS